MRRRRGYTGRVGLILDSQYNLPRVAFFRESRLRFNHPLQRLGRRDQRPDLARLDPVDERGKDPGLQHGAAIERQVLQVERSQIQIDDRAADGARDGIAPELRHDVTTLRKESLHVMAQTAGYDHSLVEPAFAVFLEARHRVTLYSDVVPALRKLRIAGYCLGTLTNGNADFERLGLGQLFDFSLSAESTGMAKPHPHMFEEACRRAQVGAAELAHIGDEPGTDLAGAQNAGVTVIWMNRGGVPADPGVSHHAEINNMTQLLALLGLN